MSNATRLLNLQCAQKFVHRVLFNGKRLRVIVTHLLSVCELSFKDKKIICRQSWETFNLLKLIVQVAEIEKSMFRNRLHFSTLKSSVWSIFEIIIYSLIKNIKFWETDLVK